MIIITILKWKSIAGRNKLARRKKTFTVQHRDLNMEYLSQLEYNAINTKRGRNKRKHKWKLNYFLI